MNNLDLNYIRLRHVVSGRYAKFNEEDQLVVNQNFDELINQSTK